MLIFKTKNYGNVVLKIGRYPIGNAIYIGLSGTNEMAGEPIGILSVNLPDNNNLLGDKEFFAKTWSENEQVAKDALASGLFTDTGRRVQTGYTEAQIWRMNF